MGACLSEAKPHGLRLTTNLTSDDTQIGMAYAYRDTPSPLASNVLAVMRRPPDTRAVRELLTVGSKVRAGTRATRGRQL